MEKPNKSKVSALNTAHIKLQQKQALFWLNVVPLMMKADQKHSDPFHLLNVCGTKS